MDTFNPKKARVYQYKKGKSLTTQFKGSKPRFVIPKKYILYSDSVKVYEKLKGMYDELKDMSYDEYKAYHDFYMEALKKQVSEDTDGIKIPNLGEIYVKRLFISSDAMKKGLYMNLDSNGKIGKIIWKRTDAMKYNLALKTHGFIPNNVLKRLTSDAINESPNDYKMAKVIVMNIKKAYPSFEKWINSGGRQELTRIKYENLKNDEQRSDIADQGTS